MAVPIVPSLESFLALCTDWYATLRHKTFRACRKLTRDHAALTGAPIIDGIRRAGCVTTLAAHHGPSPAVRSRHSGREALVGACEEREEVPS